VSELRKHAPDIEAYVELVSRIRLELWLQVDDATKVAALTKLVQRFDASSGGYAGLVRNIRNVAAAHGKHSGLYSSADATVLRGALAEIRDLIAEFDQDGRS
jgi:transposase